MAQQGPGGQFSHGVRSSAKLEEAPGVDVKSSGGALGCSRDLGVTSQVQALSVVGRKPEM